MDYTFQLFHTKHSKMVKFAKISCYIQCRMTSQKALVARDGLTDMTFDDVNLRCKFPFYVNFVVEVRAATASCAKCLKFF